MKTPTRTTIRSTWMATGVVTAIVVMMTVVAWVLLVAARRPATPPDAGYLVALKDDGLFDQFTSEPDAVAHGQQVCRHLEDGAPRQGLLADKLAVEAYCPQFSEAFRILESVTASGVFILTDSSGVGTIAADGALCKGTEGYSDVDRSTPVTVTSDRGQVLAVTSLGPGKGDGATCTFSFSFSVTEGQDRYVVAIGHRGNFIYTFDQLRRRDIQIRLGH